MPAKFYFAFQAKAEIVKNSHVLAAISSIFLKERLRSNLKFFQYQI